MRNSVRLSEVNRYQEEQETKSFFPYVSFKHYSEAFSISNHGKVNANANKLKYSDRMLCSL